ncbi:hypothetical protein [Streptomyces fulvoviolaceus]|uniref:hypothetical protein n=1 Tax=Streptomyces fulvoviolaceus TaxID=285535 RepID=UPI0021C05DB6|nr:hypothetical protein [Streptomyces fulvoviolaceus]MCT9075147.1 hypothetical protein [Streptomyces fulvoviolaceus]
MQNSPKVRMPWAIIFVLVIVTVNALSAALGGWAILQENYSKQEHNQDLLMPMGTAWFVALFCSGTAALQIVCVVLARRRRPWVNVVLVVWLIFVALSTAVGFLASLVSGAPSLAMLVLFGIDVVALWMALGNAAAYWFSVRGPAPTARQGFPA